MTYYTTDRVKLPQRRASASVMHAVQMVSGKYVAIAIRVRGSRWICHPSPDGDKWVEPTCHHPRRIHWPPPPSHHRPPRRVRKAAKIALRRWLTV